MKNNVGNIDRILRIVMGIGLLSLMLIFRDGIRLIGLIGVIPLLTGFIGFCPIYKLFGLNSCKTKNK